ncbi:GDP-mannose 4,6-dehydratase, partial [candidate division WWE3 bacterium CG_4_9_14_3_um_filter_43_9]
MKKAFITGISGFAGSHLAELLLQKKLEVHGLLRWRAKTENIDHIKNKLIFHEGDLLDPHSLDSIISEIKPDYIFHLAAQSFIPASWKSPAATLQVNIVGSANLFEAVKKTGINPTIQIAG